MKEKATKYELVVVFTFFSANAPTKNCFVVFKLAKFFKTIISFDTFQLLNAIFATPIECNSSPKPIPIPNHCVL